MPNLIDSQVFQASPFFDELLDEQGQPRPHARSFIQKLQELSAEDLIELKNSADQLLQQLGITFTVYSDAGNIDRVWPFDLLPRIIEGREWQETEAGLKQRLKALNAFIDDIYNEQRIIGDGIIPEDIISTSKNFRKECMGMKPAYGAWANICGSDIIRGKDGQLMVLEDNLRVPSGVSYMIENREVMKNVFPEAFAHENILPVDEYPNQLLTRLQSIATPQVKGEPTVVVLTPGIYNSAYFEHAYLAHEMGVELVEGADLVVGKNKCVYMRTIEGLEQVDVIYRRIDDDFLDPEVFREDSMLGVKGLMRAWRSGNVAIANAPGAGVADDKVVYAYVPQMIRYYLNEEPLLANVPTYLCREDDQRAYVLENIHQLVVKPANESGGYGMLVGPHASEAEHDKFRKLITENPRNYIAQPTIQISTAPTWTGEAIEPRHLDLRPFILHGKDMRVTAGGLTRVALKKGSLVVNSSQGGGSKDTWILAHKEAK